jgi:hypothetical protein
MSNRNPALWGCLLSLFACSSEATQGVSLPGDTAGGGGAQGGGSASTSAPAGASSSSHLGGMNGASGGQPAGGVAASAGRSTAGTASGGVPTGGRASGGSAGSAVSGGRSSAATGGGSGAGGAETLRLPTANAAFDYQIGGVYAPPPGVGVVSRDRQSAPAAGVYNICYVNGLQAQPDEEAFWQDEHPDLILLDSSGEPVVDEDWGELLLDTSTADKRAALAEIVGSWIRACGQSGFDAIEIDNLDSYGRSQGLLQQADNVAFMKALSAIAHQSGLAIAQKNSAEVLGDAAEMATDFAVVEECNRWDECGDFQAVYGDLIFIIEYRKQDFDKGCKEHPELSIVLRDLDVSTPSSSSYVFDGC